MLTGEPVACAAETALNLVGNKDNPVVLGKLCHRGKVALARNDESAFTLHRFDHDGSNIVRADFLLDARGGECSHLLARQTSIAVGVRGGDAVDLGREGTKALLVRHVLRCHAHGEVRASVIAMLDNNHCGALGEHPCDLDRVLDSLGAGVEQSRSLLVRAGGQSVQGLAHLDITGVGGHHEAGVSELCRLLGDIRGDVGIGITDGGDRDTRAEVDERVAVDVDEDSAPCPLDVDRQSHADSAGHGRVLARLEGDRGRARNGGDELALLGDAVVGALGRDGHGSSWMPKALLGLWASLGGSLACGRSILEYWSVPGIRDVE